MKYLKKLGLLWASLFPGVTNQSTSFTADVEAYIQEEVEPLARRQLVAYQFGKPLKLIEAAVEVHQNAALFHAEHFHAKCSASFAVAWATVDPVFVEAAASEVAHIGVEGGELIDDELPGFAPGKHSVRCADGRDPR